MSNAALEGPSPLLQLTLDTHALGLPRIERLRYRMEKRQASLCSERALIYTRVFRETTDEPFIVRRALGFAATLREMTIYVEEDSLVFGNQASRNFAAPIFPEYSIDWVVQELDEFALRSGDAFDVSEAVKAELRGIHSFWHGNTHEDVVNQNVSDEMNLASRQGLLHRGGISNSGDGHIVPDHSLIFEYGYRGLIDQMKARSEGELEEEQRDFYRASIISLEAALDYIKRYDPLLRQLAGKTADPDRRRELLAMADISQELLEKPVEHFYEGVMAVYLTHVLQMVESNGHSFCYGRFDQYMWNLYDRDLQSGVITEESALEILTHFFIMNSSLNKVRSFGHTRFSQGYPLYSNLMVGGYRPDGKDGTNALSYLCVEAMNLCRLAEPNFSMRYNRDTPDDLLKLAARLVRTGRGMPSMFNDHVAVKALRGIGIAEEDALDYCAIGCVETGVQGKYGPRATGMTYVNWGKMIELVLNNGTDPATQLQLVSLNGSPGTEIEFSSFDDVWEGWKRLLKFYSDLAVECDAVCDRSLEVYDASPFASVFVHNALELGKTLKRGGCKYDVVSQSNIGPSVVGNSLAVLKHFVFDTGQFTFTDLKSAMADNWQSVASRRIHRDIVKYPKFGNDNDEVDLLVKAVFESYLELLPGYRTVRSGRGPEVSRYTMSTSNITSYVPNGMVVGATPDGRFAGEPLNEGCSPTQGTDVSGPMAVISSISKLPNEKVAAGQLLNMRFTPMTLAGEENLEKFVGFLRGCLAKGIYHNQFNVVDTKTLRLAQQNPEQYTSLIVRVAGYCAQFVSLMPEAQEAIIARTEFML
jgi:pyruvate formate-lyase/glycerol dehydratase family glycyl radical enzyme